MPLEKSWDFEDSDDASDSAITYHGWRQIALGSIVDWIMGIDDELEGRGLGSPKLQTRLMVWGPGPLQIKSASRLYIDPFDLYGATECCVVALPTRGVDSMLWEEITGGVVVFRPKPPPRPSRGIGIVLSKFRRTVRGAGDSEPAAAVGAAYVPLGSSPADLSNAAYANLPQPVSGGHRQCTPHVAARVEEMTSHLSANFGAPYKGSRGKLDIVVERRTPNSSHGRSDWILRDAFSHGASWGIDFSFLGKGSGAPYKFGVMVGGAALSSLGRCDICLEGGPDPTRETVRAPTPHLV
ncbi:uncharacterized protein F4822DRAFT_429007 [Hypoxylon trugodes]|uniref:uncharacterized protein n=1 Tax=Hypoxylon trugodes TaxID=326681 RepID=UPI00219D1756|nr:uncharacterized protein F4822DRAFT_429007 [Hypoxylon trugodes]KAI1388382.1 hypothetical protein F4822DRAFT_429007 [Hypoxylon trugodes]